MSSSFQNKEIIESFVSDNGNIGYKKYSDGTLVQWDTFTMSSGDIWYNRNFLVPFISNQYNFVSSWAWNITNGGGGSASTVSRAATTTSIQCALTGANGNINYNYVVTGRWK